MHDSLSKVRCNLLKVIDFLYGLLIIYIIPQITLQFPLTKCPFLIFINPSLKLTDLMGGGGKVLFEKLTNPQLFNKYSAFYGNRSLFPPSQDSTTCPYPQPDQSTPGPLYCRVRNDSGFTHLASKLWFWPLSPSVTRPKHDADQVVKNAHSYTAFPPTPSWRGA